jgi:hypothetical protein
MASPATSTTETSESRAPKATSKLVVVELDEPQSSVSIKRMRKGKGRLLKHIDQIVEDLSADGTIKGNVQPLVIIVQEIPSPPWLLDDDDED